MGRSAKTEQRRREAITMADSHTSRRQIAKHLNVSSSTVDRYLRKYRAPQPAAVPQEIVQDKTKHPKVAEHTPRRGTYAAQTIIRSGAHELLKLSGSTKTDHTEDTYYATPPVFDTFERWPDVELLRLAASCGLQGVATLDAGMHFRLRQAPSAERIETTLQIGRTAVSITKNEDEDIAAAAAVAIQAMLWYDHFAGTFDERSYEDHFTDDLFQARDTNVRKGINKLVWSDMKLERWVGEIAQCAADGMHPPEYFDEDQQRCWEVETRGLHENAYATAVYLSDQIFTQALESGHIIVVGDKPENTHYEFDCGSLLAHIEREYGITDIEAIMQQQMLAS